MSDDDQVEPEGWRRGNVFSAKHVELCRCGRWIRVGDRIQRWTRQQETGEELTHTHLGCRP